MIRLVGISFFVLVFAYFAFFIYVGLSQDYEYDHMDWNNNGIVGVLEIIRASDIGLRKNINGCDEYFSFKDGLPIKTVCPH